MWGSYFCGFNLIKREFITMKLIHFCLSKFGEINKKKKTKLLPELLFLSKGEKEMCLKALVRDRTAEPCLRRQMLYQLRLCISRLDCGRSF